MNNIPVSSDWHRVACCRVKFQALLLCLYGWTVFLWRRKKPQWGTEGQDEKIVSISEAVECLKKCLSWMERHYHAENYAALKNDGTLNAYEKFYFDTKWLTFTFKTNVKCNFRPM